MTDLQDALACPECGGPGVPIAIGSDNKLKMLHCQVCEQQFTPDRVVGTDTDPEGRQRLPLYLLVGGFSTLVAAVIPLAVYVYALTVTGGSEWGAFVDDPVGAVATEFVSVAGVAWTTWWTAAVLLVYAALILALFCHGRQAGGRL